jgi:hypothetical protein
MIPENMTVIRPENAMLPQSRPMTMGKRKVRLMHFSYHKDAAGQPGDVIEIDEGLAKEWLASGGCVYVDEVRIEPSHPADVAPDRPTKRQKPSAD